MNIVDLWIKFIAHCALSCMGIESLEKTQNLKSFIQLNWKTKFFSGLLPEMQVLRWLFR